MGVMMKNIFKQIIAGVLLLTLGSTLFATYPGINNTDRLGHRDAMDELWANIVDYTDEEAQQAQLDIYNTFPPELRSLAFGLEARHVQLSAIKRNMRSNLRQDMQPQQRAPQVYAPVQSRYTKEDKAVMSIVATTFAYWGMYHYLFAARVAAYMPHPDYAFAVGSAGIAAWLAHKAYTATCENVGHRIIKGIVCVGAASSAIYALDFVLRSKN
jgi:hypothetical protein